MSLRTSIKGYSIWPYTNIFIWLNPGFYENHLVIVRKMGVFDWFSLKVFVFGHIVTLFDLLIPGFMRTICFVVRKMGF